MRTYKYHIFICEHRRDPSDPRGSCAQKDSGVIRECFKKEIKARGLRGIARANQAGCLDTCELGPSVVVYPEGVWYTVRTEDEAAEIVEKHVVGGTPVEHLRMEHRRKPPTSGS